MRDFNDLLVFQRAHHVTVRLHAISAAISTRKYPGLASQLRRSAQSVPANIAEGCGHSSRREFARFLQLALASNVETNYHIKFAVDIKAIAVDEHAEINAANNEVRRMLASLLRRVREELSPEDGEALAPISTTVGNTSEANE